MAMSSSEGFKVTLDGFPPMFDGEGGGFSLSDDPVAFFFSLFGSSSFSASSSSCLSPSQSEVGRLGRVEVTVEVVEDLGLRSGEEELRSSVENLHENKDQCLISPAGTPPRYFHHIRHFLTVLNVCESFVPLESRPVWAGTSRTLSLHLQSQNLKNSQS